MPTKPNIPNYATSEAVLSELFVNGTLVDEAERKRLKEQLAAGELDAIEFDARVFRAIYPNANYLRFRDDDLPAFADSFAGQPFLRNHDHRHIEARDGTVDQSRLQGNQDFIQSIRLTTERGMRSFVEGQIDRFSISWYWDAITCSVCNEEWFSGGCWHWPGRTYEVKDDEGNKQKLLCELIFEKPRAKETSAVNVPAVEGTGILAQLCEAKHQLYPKKGDSIMSDQTSPTPAADIEEAPPPATDLPVVPPTEAWQTGEQEVPEIEANGNGHQLTSSPPLRPGAAQGQNMADWIGFIQQTALDAALANSGLPAAFQDAVREEFEGVDNPKPANVTAAIERQRKVWAKLNEDNVIHGVGTPRDHAVVNGMRTGMDDMREAVEWLFGVEDAQLPPPQLRRIDNVYMLLTGDYGWHGVFHPDQAALAAADTTTLADLAVNAMNKVIVPLWNGLAMYRWFEDLVVVQPNDGSVQNMQWIQFGGISNLSEVSEGGAYTEKTVADSREIDSFQKYGNYVGITLEMIRNSAIAQIQAVTRGLAVAAVRTRSAKIASIFTANSGVGPTLDDDSVALFHTASHGNLATTAFSWTAWKAARIECAKQTELGSSKRQGLFPRYGLFPVDLYDEALVVFGYGQGTGGKPATGDNDVNPFGEGRPGDPRPIPRMVPDWTDTNNWAYLADPMLAPIIQMSYAQNPSGGRHPLPELFTATNQNSGLLFTNDTLPIKVRDWFAYGVATYRGIGKRNVT